MITRLAPICVALATLAGGAAHAQDVDLTATLDQCRPDVARATTDELVARAQAAGWTDFEKTTIGQLPVMAATRTAAPQDKHAPTASFGVLGVNGGGVWAFVCAVETKPARQREVTAWAKSVYRGADDKGWVGTRTGEAMVKEDRAKLVKTLPARLADLPAGQRIVMFSITGDRKTSTVTTQIFEKID